MFFICGVNSRHKELQTSQLVICGNCGGYGRYQVFMTYTSLSLFFIPILKWGKRYYVRMSCCETLYGLNPDKGKRIAWGEQVEITPQDLTLIKAGRRTEWRPSTGRRRICGHCGYETEEDFTFCPKCGGRLDEKM